MYYAGRGCISVSVQQNEDTPSHVQVRIWQLPSTPPSRWGPLSRPHRDRFPRRSPCRPSHLSSKPCRWVSPSPEPACSPARSLEESWCISELFHILWVCSWPLQDRTRSRGSRPLMLSEQALQDKTTTTTTESYEKYKLMCHSSHHFTNSGAATYIVWYLPVKSFTKFKFLLFYALNFLYSNCYSKYFNSNPSETASSRPNIQHQK